MENCPQIVAILIVALRWLLDGGKITSLFLIHFCSDIYWFIQLIKTLQKEIQSGVWFPLKTLFKYDWTFKNIWAAYPYMPSVQKM